MEKKLISIKSKRKKSLFILDEGRLNILRKFLNGENVKFRMLSEKYSRIGVLDIIKELLLIGEDLVISDLLLEESIAIVLYLLYSGNLDRLTEFVRRVSGRSIILPFAGFLKEDLEYIIGAYNLEDKVSFDLWDDDVVAIIKSLKYLDSCMKGSLYRFWMGLVKKHSLMFGS